MTEPNESPTPRRISPRHRAYAKREHGKDVDAGERTQAALTLLMGFLFGSLVAWRMGYPFLLGGILGAPFVYFTVRVILSLGARAVVGSLGLG